MNRELRAAISTAFADVVHPGKDRLIQHKCEECFGVQRDFGDMAWQHVQSSTIEANYDKLPLFTSAAFQYYLPAFLIYCLNEPQSEVCEFTLYSLANVKEETAWWLDRVKRFTKEQKGAINMFLRWISSASDYIDDKEMIERAIKRWWIKDEP